MYTKYISLLGHLMHTVRQMCNILRRNASDRNPAIFGQINREFFGEALNLGKKSYYNKGTARF